MSVCVSVCAQHIEQDKQEFVAEQKPFRTSTFLFLFFFSNRHKCLVNDFFLNSKHLGFCLNKYFRMIIIMLTNKTKLCMHIHMCVCDSSGSGVADRPMSPSALSHLSQDNVYCPLISLVRW